MSEKTSIQNYYNQLATDYDDDRFNNTYGQYLHLQERQILQRQLAGIPLNNILDMGCGTGRFLQYAGHGVDFSEGMLQQAQSKFPNHQLTVSDISNMPFDDESFKAIYSLHVFMHLDMETIEASIRDAHRILESDGILIFDFPSKSRRQLINYKKDGWHGNTALDIATVEQLSKGLFYLENYEGVLFFPIHRIPNRLRSFFRFFDSLLCRSFLRKCASYHFVFLRKV